MCVDAAASPTIARRISFLFHWCSEPRALPSFHFIYSARCCLGAGNGFFSGLLDAGWRFPALGGFSGAFAGSLTSLREGNPVQWEGSLTLVPVGVCVGGVPGCVVFGLSVAQDFCGGWVGNCVTYLQTLKVRSSCVCFQAGQQGDL